MLTTRETTLRPYADEDLPVLASLRNDVALQRSLLAVPRGSSLAQVRAWLSDVTTDRASLFFVIAARTDGHAVGFIQLVRIDPVHGHGELGLALRADARGDGHGSDAIRLLEGHAADVLRVRKVVLRALASNEGATRLYRRLGYREVGTMRAHFFHGGTFHDVVLFERLLPDFTEEWRRRNE